MLRQHDPLRESMERAFMGFQALRGVVVAPRVKCSVWRFNVVDDDGLCEDCEKYHGDVYELDDPADLLGMFEYGEFVDDDAFLPNVHPNCRCIIMKEEEVLFGEVSEGE